MASPWLQNFFNLGGIAGAASFVWQIAGAVNAYRKKAWLTCGDMGIIDMPMPDPKESRRFITLDVVNAGRSTALGCVAKAKATPLSGEGGGRWVPLHWADTPKELRSSGGFPVNIARGHPWRLDVVYSQYDCPGCWLAEPQALGAHYHGTEKLIQGSEYRIEVIVTFDDGNMVTPSLRLSSPPTWDKLNLPTLLGGE